MSADRSFESSKSKLFNTPLEAGLRAVVILDAFAPRAFDLANLSLLDYYAVHSADMIATDVELEELDGISLDSSSTDSLHPPIASRKGEYFVRRRLIEEGVVMMERAFLIDRVANDEGLSFRARDVAAAMVDLMESEYNAQLRGITRRLARLAQIEGEESFFNRLADGVDRWAHEIEGEISR